MRAYIAKERLFLFFVGVAIHPGYLFYRRVYYGIVTAPLSRLIQFHGPEADEKKEVSFFHAIENDIIVDKSSK